MVKPLKAAELFLSLGLVASVAIACTAPQSKKTQSQNTVAEMPESTGSAEGGEGGEGGAGFESLNWANTFDDQAVIAEFTDTVVIPNYEQYADNVAALSQAIEKFAAAPENASLQATREAWTATRGAWETTETFAFGPAGSLGLDGAMDAWPVNQTDIETILASANPITVESVAQLQDTERGMHAIEYLLFGTKADKALANFNERETELLVALGQDLGVSANALLASWQTGTEGQPAYKTVFTSAGSADNQVYPTTTAAGQELVSGIINSLTEVGEDKLKAPFEEQNVQGLESQFSAQTMNDLKSNLQSAQNGYLGEFPAQNRQAAASISSYVAGLDPAVDKAVREQFEQATAALEAVPTPLEQHLTDPAAAEEIEGAIAAILAVKFTLESKVVPLI